MHQAPAQAAVRGISWPTAVVEDISAKRTCQVRPGKMPLIRIDAGKCRGIEWLTRSSRCNPVTTGIVMTL